jgi:hypothetical protein
MLQISNVPCFRVWKYESISHYICAQTEHKYPSIFFFPGAKWLLKVRLYYIYAGEPSELGMP